MQRFPPGPKTAPGGLDFVQRFKDDPLNTAKSLKHDYGDVIHLKLGPFDWYVFNTAESVRDIFVTGSKVFGKTSRFKQVLATVDGQGLVLSEGDFWLKQRRIIQPSFHHDHLKTYAEIMIAKCNALMSSWTAGQQFDLAEQMTDLTLQVIARILFGIDVGNEAKHLGDAVTTISRILYRELSDLFLLPEWLPLPSKIEKHKATELIDNLISRAIEQARVQPGCDTIIATLLATVDDADGKGMTMTQLRDEAITLFNAGHDSTAAALSWCWYLLAKNPSIYDEFLAQVDRLGGAPVTMQDLAKVPMTMQVAKETLRLYPPAWVIPRQCTQDTEVEGYHIKKDSLVNCFPYIIQRDKRYFAEPEKFDPERFSPAREHDHNQFAWFPFGVGPRACIGKDFALMEMQIVLATVSQRYRFELVNNQEIEPEPLISLEPKGGVPVVVRLR